MVNLCKEKLLDSTKAICIKSRCTFRQQYYYLQCTRTMTFAFKKNIFFFSWNWIFFLCIYILYGNLLKLIMLINYWSDTACLMVNFCLSAMLWLIVIIVLCNIRCWWVHCISLTLQIIKYKIIDDITTILQFLHNISYLLDEIILKNLYYSL